MEISETRGRRRVEVSILNVLMERKQKMEDKVIRQLFSSYILMCKL